MLEVGKYPAKAVNAGISMTKDNEPQPWIKFAVEGTEITWYGSLKNEKSQQFAAKALVAAGFEGNDIVDLTKPFMTVFSPKECSVELEMYKEKLKVKWVNAKYEPKAFTGTLPKLSGVFAQVKQEMGAKKKAAQPAANDAF